VGYFGIARKAQRPAGELRQHSLPNCQPGREQAAAENLPQMPVRFRSLSFSLSEFVGHCMQCMLQPVLVVYGQHRMFEGLVVLVMLNPLFEPPVQIRSSHASALMRLSKTSVQVLCTLCLHWGSCQDPTPYNDRQPCVFRAHVQVHRLALVIAARQFALCPRDARQLVEASWLRVPSYHHMSSRVSAKH
jgi:hypothetical protein